ncbi:enoyl-CoA hydratase/isomerase family protein [Methylobacterium nonmethylotrophicum]|uniref:enoyl-CoA hydratase/isomerase family protein n=1 Tax=Methylobacterium nonmethylotrophicum TaxID=1141884 RepID=UPI00197C6692|nr:enoyl-CoA hydratase-related protein [Methylobacterium nonmethylotrophicum]
MSGDAVSLRVERRGAAAFLTFDRPAVLNALDLATADLFLAAVRTAAADEAVRVVVMRGAGRAFMAGGDVATFLADGAAAEDRIAAIIAALHEALQILATCDKPVLAAIHGAVAGAGVSLMLAADLVIAADDARLTLAYTRLGTSADGGASCSLPRVVGLRKAMEIALLNPVIDAAEAQRLSLVNRVVPADEFPAAVEALAERLAAGSLVACGAMKRLLRASFARSFPDQLAAEAESFLACAASPDFREGVAAFIAKRPPRFPGT